ncbi:MAG: DUF4857 domain-containing protein [Muribaculaceae bacterium]|nr:DUF4857 domain-containing protein [Muribaculaceae bacterium]
MKTLYRIILTLLCLTVFGWILPRIVSLVFAQRSVDPFVNYSSVVDRFIVSDGGADDDLDIYDVDPATYGRVMTYSREQRDSLLPEIYANQLLKRNAMPDLLRGIAIDPSLIRRFRWIFNSQPADINRCAPAVYPLMESMPLRFDLEDPKYAFTLDDGRIDVFEIEGMRNDGTKSARFDKMLKDRGFKFPAREVKANITTRKPYDSGYLIIDASGDIYHLKMQAGRPAIASIPMPDSLSAEHVFVTEFGDRDFLGFAEMSDGCLWGIDFDDYSMTRLPVDRINLEKDRLSILRGIATWTAKINAPDSVRWIAVDASDYSFLASYSRPMADSRADKVASWIVPYKIEFTSDYTGRVSPHFSFGSFRAIALWTIIIILIFTFKYLKMKKIKSIAGLFALLVLCSCGSKSGESASATADSNATSAITVDDVLTSPADYVDMEITVEGVCSHLCRHGGRKAFLAGSANNFLLRCEAYPLMNEPFPASTIHHPMTVKGYLREERVDEEAVQQMEWSYNEAMLNAAAQGQEFDTEKAAQCDTEQAARGQQGLADFNARMADYRARIKARQDAEGIPYLSFYYLEAEDYEVLE